MREIKTKVISHRFRGKTSSKQQNELNENIYADLFDMFSMIHGLEAEAAQILLIMMSNGASVSNNINELINKIDQLEKRVESIETNASRVIKQVYPEDMTTVFPNPLQDDENLENRALIMNSYGIVQPEVSHFIPKSYIQKESGEFFVPEELEVEVSRLSVAQATTRSKNEKNMFNEKLEEYFLYDVEYNTQQVGTEESIKIIIDLPAQITHQKKINTIKINTYPLTSTVVDSIYVHYKGTQREIVDLHKKQVNSELKGHLKFSFEEQYADKVEIIIKNKELLRLVGHNSRRVLGSNLVEIGYETISEGRSLVLAKFAMKGLYSIEDVTCEFKNRKAFSFSSVLDSELKGTIYKYTLMKKDADGTLRALSENQLTKINEKEIWVAVRLDKDPNNGVIPLLERINLQIKPE